MRGNEERFVQALERERIVAVIRLPSYGENGMRTAEALLRGGISVLEFAFSGEGAPEAIAGATEAFGQDAVIGAGTVTSVFLAEQAVDAGASFLVTPVVHLPVIELARSRGVPVLCGALTPSEVFAASGAGAAMIKVFPAARLGPTYLNDLLGPFPGLKLVPTGGINAQNAASFLRAGAAAVGIGGSLVEPSLVEQKDFREIEARALACREAIR